MRQESYEAGLTDDPSYDAIVLAGGPARRLGGVDKARLEVAGRRMLDTALAACAAASRLVVVGPVRPLPPRSRQVTWAREEPGGTGPLAALAAALPHLDEDITVVLSTDLPFIAETTVRTLVTAIRRNGEPDGALLVDIEGREQFLAAAYRRAALARRIAELGKLDDLPVWRLAETLDLVCLPDTDGSAFDCDTWDDLAHARARARAGR